MTDEHEQLLEGENSLWKSMATALSSSFRWQFWIKAVLILGGVAIGAVGGLLEPARADETPWKLILGLGGTGMASFGGALALLADHRSTKLLENARDYVGQARRFLIERDELRAREDWREACATALDVLLMTVEKILVSTGSPIEKQILTLLEVTEAPMLAALRVEMGEDWTISVFQRQGAHEGEMVRIASVWADTVACQKDNRSWKRQQGFTGGAWARNRPIFEADTLLPLSKAHYNVPPEKFVAAGNADNLRPDDDRFRSVACLPIRVANEEPWGILTVTSDRVGRFDEDDTQPGAANKLTLRHLEAAIALVVAGYQES